VLLSAPTIIVFVKLMIGRLLQTPPFVPIATMGAADVPKFCPSRVNVGFGVLRPATVPFTTTRRSINCADELVFRSVKEAIKDNAKTIKRRWPILSRIMLDYPFPLRLSVDVKPKNRRSACLLTAAKLAG
jgi:hypothetical protein